MPIQNFRAHVNWATYKRLKNGLLSCFFGIVLRKTKISNLIAFIPDEDVGWFQIPMDDFSIVKFFVPSDDLFCDHENFGLGKPSSLVENIFERAFVTKFLKQVDVVSRFFYIVEGDDVWMLKRFHNFDFVPEGLVKFFRIFLDVGG
jgi:hypothetical protein